MLETLVTSKTRRKLLLKFFLNSSIRSYLRDLEGEFGESTNSIRLELNRFEEAGMLRGSLATLPWAVTPIPLICCWWAIK